jgi:hypothetical protein
MLKALFFKNKILEWYANTRLMDHLIERGKFLEELSSRLSEHSISQDVSTFILTEKSKTDLEKTYIKHQQKDHNEVIAGIIEKARILMIRETATDFGAINPDIVANLIQNKTEAFFNDIGNLVVRMKDKKSLMSSVRSMKRNSSYGHLFR